MSEKDKDFDDIDDGILSGSPADAGKLPGKGTAGRSKPGQRSTSTRGSGGVRQSLHHKLSNRVSGLSSGLRAVQLILWALLFLAGVVALVYYEKYGSAFLLGMTGVVVFFLYLFTGSIDAVKMNGMVIYCYLFTIVALIGSIVPFFYFDKFVFYSSQEKMHTSPLGIMKACIKATSDDDQVPREMDCKKEKTQWVINIGGTVQRKPAGNCVTDQCIKRERRLHPELYRNDRVQISGGLVVPLYVLVFSIIGAAVNMARRVPEYQRQVHLYLNDNGGLRPQPDEISCEDAREFMVFQLMQVISAPMLAITVYYFLEPNSTTTSVVLGFFSGFASETMLISLRAFADKLMPSAVVSRMKGGGYRNLKSEDS